MKLEQDLRRCIDQFEQLLATGQRFQESLTPEVVDRIRSDRQAWLAQKKKSILEGENQWDFSDLIEDADRLWCEVSRTIDRIEADAARRIRRRRASRLRLVQPEEDEE